MCITFKRTDNTQFNWLRPGADPAHFLTFSKAQNIKPHPNTTPKDHTQTIIIVLIIMPERSRTIEISEALYLQNQN